MMKKVFYLALKALFVLKIFRFFFTFWSCRYDVLKIVWEDSLADSVKWITKRTLRGYKKHFLASKELFLEQNRKKQGRKKYWAFQEVCYLFSVLGG